MDDNRATQKFSYGRFLTVITTVAAAYFVFRQFAHLAPLPHNITKLVLWTVAPLAVLLAERRADIRAVLGGLGLRNCAVKSLLPGIAALGAAGGTLLALGARLPANSDLAAPALTAIVAPFAEELLFRGYLVNGLVASGLGRVRAVVIGGLLFGLAHFGNVLDATPSTMFLEMGITAGGGMLFSWTLLRFDGSLVAAFAFHAGLNLPWDAFAVDSTAIGGGVGNIARATGIAAGVVTVLLLTRPPKPG